MGVKSYAPRTRQFDERPITRVQENFMAGMFDDLPATSIPDNGVAYLKNFINHGDRLTGRYGSKLWGNYKTKTPCADLPSIAEGFVYTSTVMDKIRTIEIDDLQPYDYDITDKDVGNFFKVGNKWEQIVQVLTPFVIQTDTNSALDVSGTGKIRGGINGLYFHKRMKKIVLHIGTEIYVSSNVYVAEWVKVIQKTVISISNSPSTFDEFNNNLVIFNEHGIFTTNLSDETPYYYKVNADIPEWGYLENILPGEFSDYPMIRRYIYTMSKFDTDDVNNVGHLTDRPILESGSNGGNKDYRDYWESGDKDYTPPEGEEEDYTPRIFDARTLNCPMVRILDRDVFDTQWDTYSVYSTANLSKDSTDLLLGSGNQSEAYAISGDVPLASPYRIKLNRFITQNYIVFDVIDGSISTRDIGNRLIFWGIVDNPNSPTEVWYRRFSSFTLIDVKVVNGVTELFCTGETTNLTIGSELVGSLGFGDASYVKITPSSNSSLLTIPNEFEYLRFCRANGLKTYDPNVSLDTQGFGYIGFPDDIFHGTKLFLSNGKTAHVKKRIDKNTIELYETFEEEVSLVCGFPLYTEYNTTTESWMRLSTENIKKQNSRRFQDRNSEFELKSRLIGFPLYNRFYTPLPDKKIGTIAQGFLFCSDTDDNKISYCGIANGFEYMIGYHHPTYQFFELKENFVGFGQLPDNLVVFGNNSTSTVPLNLVNERQIPEVGSTVPVIAGITQVDSNIGALKQQGIQESEKGRMIVITSEPGIRVFNGRRYSSDISSQRLSSILKSLRSNITSIYSPVTGFLLWGSDIQ